MQDSRWCEFGKWVVQRREMIGLSQRKAAARLMISGSHLSKIEAGNPSGISLQLIKEMAGLFGVPEDEILFMVGRLPEELSESIAQQISEIIRSGKRWEVKVINNEE